MRIISGKHKNKKIITDRKWGASQYLKPTTEKTRQAMFNIISHTHHIKEGLLQDAMVLDLFCGSGALGIEALSRGSKFVTFVDKEPAHLMLCKKNIAYLNETDRCEFINSDATRIAMLNIQYNIIFIDPPYHQPQLIQESLLMLDNTKCLAQDHIIIIEHSIKKMIQLAPQYELLLNRSYGISALTICKHVHIPQREIISNEE